MDQQRFSVCSAASGAVYLSWLLRYIFLCYLLHQGLLQVQVLQNSKPSRAIFTYFCAHRFLQNVATKPDELLEGINILHFFNWFNHWFLNRADFLCWGIPCDNWICSKSNPLSHKLFWWRFATNHFFFNIQPISFAWISSPHYKIGKVAPTFHFVILLESKVREIWSTLE